MKVAAIITEYNPFHNGHKYQVDKIRELLGDDTVVIAIMSGNFTQRGEIAIADKTVRAKAAVECGVNLVLELPFPFSMSSAEFFAKGGVYIANALGIVDYLVFGSECGNIRELSDIASIMLSSEYQLYLDSLKNSPDYRDAGYPELCEKALSDIYGKEFSRDFFSPNNILGIEYIKALKSLNSDIEALTIRREGAGYLDIINPMAEFQSASAIREEIACKNLSALDFVPQNAKNIYTKAIDEGKMPSDISRLDLALISFFRLNSPKADMDIHDATGGLYNRLCEMSAEATSISNLTKRTETKKYTTARIRRAIWNSYFGVTSSDIRSMPSYTQVLAMDSTGRAALKRIKKVTDFPVITKPSSYKDMDEQVVKQKEMSNKADSVFALTLKVANSGRFALTFTPYVKE
jgi:predicted nucleotidyltransferase